MRLSERADRGGARIVKGLRVCTIVMVVVLAGPVAVHGQASVANAPPTQRFALDDALQYAIDHYPGIRAAMEQVTVARGAVSVARSAALPRLDSLWQTNRATANNIFGQVLPQSVLPSISGPVLPS